MKFLSSQKFTLLFKIMQTYNINFIIPAGQFAAFRIRLSAVLYLQIDVV